MRRSYGHEALYGQVPISLGAGTTLKPPTVRPISRRALMISAILAGRDAVPAVEANAGWISCASMPIPRSEMPATVLDGLIYVAGGFGADRKAHSYDPLLDSWDELPDLPTGTNHPGIASWKSRVIVAGGYSADGSSASQEIWSFVPGEKQWDVIGRLPHPMGAFGFATIDEIIYLVGGAFDRLGGPPTAATWSWDPQADDWAVRSPIPDAREHLAVVSHGEKLYAVGGRVHGQASPELGASLTIYDPIEDKWSDGGNLYPPRSGLNGASSCSGIVVAGGETPTKVFSDVNVLNPVTGGWTALPDLPIAVHGVALAAYDTWIYAIGGSSRAGSIESTAAVWKFSLPCS